MSNDGDFEFEIGSGNVFADTGVANPEDALARAELMSRVVARIRNQRLSDVRAAEILGTDVSELRYLLNGKLHKFSRERLMAYAAALGLEVS